MKYIILLIMLLATFVMGQTTVRTVPATSSSQLLMNSTTVTGSLTPQYGTTFGLDGKQGATTIFLLTDTTGASVESAQQSDSCLTLVLQIKDNNVGWSRYYDETTTYTKLDTIDRALVNTGGTVPLRMNLPDVTSSKQWSLGDSARIGIIIGVGDSLLVTMTQKQY